MTFFLMIFLITNQGLTAAEENSPVNKFNVSINAGGFFLTGTPSGFVGVKFNYYVKEKWFISPELATVNFRLIMPGITINKIIKNSFFLGAGGYFINISEYKDFFLKFQGGNMFERFEITGFIMTLARIKSFMVGMSVGIYLKKK